MQRNFKKGLAGVAISRLIWGFLPLYWIFGPSDDMPLLMALRACGAFLFSLTAILLQGKLPQLKAALSSHKVMCREAVLSIFLAGDWVIYLYGVMSGHTVDCSLGYLIQPIFILAMSVLVFHETITRRQLAILALVLVGVALTASAGGKAIYITLSLVVMFAVYGALKRTITLEAIISTAIEIGFVSVPALLYLLFRVLSGSFPPVTPVLLAFYVGAGLLTCVPVVAHSVALQNLPFTVIGIAQYISPVLAFTCGLMTGETVQGTKLVGVVVIALGVALYAVETFVLHEKKK